MSESPDLIDKTDALLSRYRGNPKHAPESDFPVLTDIYDKHASAASPHHHPVAGTAGSAESLDSGFSQPSEISPDLLVEKVMRQLAPYIDQALGESLRESLEEQLRRILPALTEQVRIDIESRIKGAVSQAVHRANSAKQ